VRPAVREVRAWCGAVVYPVALYLTVLNWPPDGRGQRLILPAVLAVLPVGLLRRRPLPALALMLAGSFAAVAAPGDHPDLVSASPPGWQLGYLQALVTCLAVGLIAATRPLRTAIAAAVLTLGVQAAAATYYTYGSDRFTTAVLLLVLALIAAAMIGYSLRERREHARTVRAQAMTHAITAERLRIARELHDLVAHSIGVIAIQAGTGRRVIHTQPAEARNALAAIETTSRETLAGLRRMLGALRKAEADPDPGPEGALPGVAPEGAPREPAPGLADIDRLVESTHEAGVRVDVDWRGRRGPLPAEIELSAFRIIQEALTNVVRHAGTHECRVVIDHQDDELSIEVTDDGPGTGGVGTGYGITGMRERVGLLHGRFTAGPRPEGGFRVAARLPVPAQVR
jgi:signal transduction histidine kinase